MKFILIMYNEAMENDVQDVLTGCGIETYTQWDKTYGKGHHSGPHLGTHIWPKQNNMIAVAVSESQAAELLEAIRSLREEYAREGIKAFQLPLEDLTE